MITRGTDHPRRKIFQVGRSAISAVPKEPSISKLSRMALRMLPIRFSEGKMTCHAQCRQTIDRPMARHLFLVSRHETRLHEYLLERFRDDGNVEVILDRRCAERRRRSPGHGQEADRRRSERRTRREIDLELQVRSHVILTFPDDDPAPRL